MPARKYTSEQFSQAVTLRLQGLSLTEIEKQTGVPKASCTSHFKVMGVRLEQSDIDRLRNKISDEKIAEMLQRRRNGESAKNISKALGIAVKTVYNISTREGVLLTDEQIGKSHERPKHDYASLVSARLAGATIAELASKTGIPYSTLEGELPWRGGRVGKRRTWGEFQEGVTRAGLECISAPVEGKMRTIDVTLRCFCGREFTLKDPRSVLYNRVSSCGCLSSKAEKEIGDFVVSLGFEVKRNTRKVLKDKTEIDILVPSRGIGIEYNGLHFHSEGVLGKNYHLTKMIQAENVGIRLVQVFENEWLNRPQVVKAYLSTILGIVEHRVGARKTELQELVHWGEINNFLEEHHIQGTTAAGTYSSALYFQGEMVAALVCRLAYLRGPITEDRVKRWELTRYCVKSGWAVSGGFDKLWSGFIKAHTPSEVISFSDKRWSIGGLYKRSGFVYSGSTKPSYWYFKENERPRILYHKSVFQRKRIEKNLGPILPGEGEYEAMLRFGYERIWDCGLDRWLWHP